MAVELTVKLPNRAGQLGARLVARSPHLGSGSVGWPPGMF